MPYIVSSISDQDGSAWGHVPEGEFATRAEAVAAARAYIDAYAAGPTAAADYGHAGALEAVILTGTLEPDGDVIDHIADQHTAIIAVAA